MSKFDVIVVGGGLIGTSIAFELAAQELRVALIDRQQPGREASWAAAGMLSPGPESPEALPLVPLAKESLRLYPAFVSSIEAASGQSMAFARQGTFEVFKDPGALAARDKLLALYSRAGLAAESMTMASARAYEPAIHREAAAVAWLPDEASLDPRMLIDAAVVAARNRGVEIFAAHPVSSILSERGRCNGVIARGQRISGDQVVIAAGSFCAEIPCASPGTSIEMSRYAPVHPVRGQMMAMRSNKVKLKKVLRSERGYLVPRPDGRIIAGSTVESAGFEKNTTPEGLRSIFEAATALAPELADAEIIETWAGLRPGTPDQLPIIGPTDIPGLLIATGHYRNGILLAPVTARLICDWVLATSTSFRAEEFSPLRFSAANSSAKAVSQFRL